MKKIAIVHIKQDNGTLKEVTDVLKKKGVKYSTVERDSIRQGMSNGADLVIAIGGDGTFLRTSHLISDDTPILGVNSDPKTKEGFFMATDKRGFAGKIESILEGDYQTVELTRLQAIVGRKKIADLALNEVYFGPYAAFRTARYTVTLGDRKEFQKSSGMLVGTASGSHAWMKGCGGKVLPKESRKIQFVVREPIHGKTINCRMNKGFIADKIELISDMYDGVVIIDSLSKEHRIKMGEKVTITRSEKMLKVVL